jgi:hypothetical protein
MGAGIGMVAVAVKEGQIVAEPSSHKAFIHGLFRNST